MPNITRSPHNPLITPESDPSILGNINGPSLIRVPDWVPNPLGRYYLYFAHHQGKFIRMAYADDLLGPYTVHTPGVLPIEDTLFERHIASPDVHIDNDAKVIRMFYHGAGFTGPKYGGLNQNTCHAESSDGLSFTCDKVCIGPSYMRVWEWNGAYYGFGGGGGRALWRSDDFRKPFQPGTQLAVDGEDYTPTENVQDLKKEDAHVYRMRHCAVDLHGHELDIYYSNVGDHPERIKRTTVDLRDDWSTWSGALFEEVVRTETDYEGVNEPDIPSTGGADHDPVHQLRDPYLFNEQDHKYLVYSIAGEKGLAIAKLEE